MLAPRTTERAGSTAWRRANSSTRPGSGGRHRQTGGPAACEQSAASTAPDTISPTAAAVASRCHAVGAPVEDEVRRGGLGCRERSLPLGLAVRDSSHEDPCREPTRMRHALERNALHAREALVVGRRLEFAERPHLLRGREKSGLGACGLLQLLRLREVAEAVEQALDEDFALRLRERRVKQADSRPGRAVACCGLDNTAPRRAREVRVVEDDLSAAARRPVERVRELAEKATASTLRRRIPPEVPARDIAPPRPRYLPAPGYPTTSTTSARSAPPRNVAPVSAGGAAVARASTLSQRGTTRRPGTAPRSRAGRLRAAHTGYDDHMRPEHEQPARARPRRARRRAPPRARQAAPNSQPTGAARAAERRVSDHGREPPPRRALDDPAARRRGSSSAAERDLARPRRRVELDSLVELQPAHVSRRPNASPHRAPRPRPRARAPSSATAFGRVGRHARGTGR